MRTPITYWGGKQTLAPTILSLIPPHRIYCEPFFGGGAVFFEKPKSYLEVINDTNEKLITFYKQVINNFEELNDMVQTSLCSESEYKKAKEIYNGHVNASNVEVAWAFWMVTNFSIGGTPQGGWKWDNGSYGSHAGIYMRRRREEFTSWLHERLSAVQISCRDALEVIRLRDTKETFFYLDPPYPMADMKHYNGYTFGNLENLLKLLETIKGKFILSNYESDMLSDFISRNNWQLMKIKLPLNITNFTRTKRKVEVLVFNYKTCRELTLWNQ